PDDVNATYAFDRNSWSRSQIEVSAPTREKAVSAARALGDIVAKAYDAAGETTLDVRVPSRAYPEDNATTAAVRSALTFGAPLRGGLCWRGGGWRSPGAGAVQAARSGGRMAGAPSSLSHSACPSRSP